jgi:hypothetical protein
VLVVWLPLIAFSYFGTLAIAAWFFPHGYSWRHKSLSKLLYPGYDPEFHYVASFGVALAGLLMVPFGSYIRRKLRAVSAGGVDAGVFAFSLGAISLTLASLIVSHPAHGTSAFPRLHEIFARTAAVALGAGMIILWVCVIKGYLASLMRGRDWRWLLVCWSLVALPAFSIALLRAAGAAHLDWTNPIYRRLENPSLWHLGFWEWLGSAAIFLFMLSAALFLPEHDSVPLTKDRGEVAARSAAGRAGGCS